NDTNNDPARGVPNPCKKMYEIFYILTKMLNIKTFPVTLGNPVIKLDKGSDKDHRAQTYNCNITPAFHEHRAHHFTLLLGLPIGLDLTYSKDHHNGGICNEDIGYRTQSDSYAAGNTLPV